MGLKLAYLKKTELWDLTLFSHILGHAGFRLYSSFHGRHWKVLQSCIIYIYFQNFMCLLNKSGLRLKGWDWGKLEAEDCLVNELPQ